MHNPQGYISTRGGEPVSLAQALDRGLAPDGGLYIPTHLDPLGAPPISAGRSLADTARWAASTLLPDVDAETMAEVAGSALDFETPLVEAESGLFVLELFHGPTHAFKDVGARFMARLMTRILPADRTRTVLVATSGDTGGAVAAAFHGVPGYRVAVLFPRDGVSERQRRQMTTLGGNVTALAVEGTFDDCQRLAKECFMDRGVSERFGLTSANSINIGRLLPQAFYYLNAALALGWQERRPHFVVPCGNLGNLCAGLIAHRQGMPAGAFVAATNTNRMFVEFLESGYADARPSIPTASNAMDVGAPSNIERIEWLYRDDPSALHRDLRGLSVTESETADTIRDVYEGTGYVLDPHTAVAYHAARRVGTPDREREPLVVLATAHPAKFPEVVERMIGREVALPEGLALAMARPEHTTFIPAELAAVTAALAATEGELR